MGGQWKLEIAWKEFWIFFTHFSQRNRSWEMHTETDSENIQNCENKMKKHY